MGESKADGIIVSKTTRKIERTVYIVSSTYTEDNQRDLVSIVARLIRSEADLSADHDETKSA